MILSCAGMERFGVELVLLVWYFFVLVSFYMLVLNFDFVCDLKICFKLGDDGFKVIVIGEMGEGAVIFWSFFVLRNDDILSMYILTLLE